MEIYKTIKLTRTEKDLLTNLKKELEYLLMDEDDFTDREIAENLYDALYDFIEEFL